MKNLVAYHGDAGIKTRLLKSLREHAKADRLVKGQYWQDGKGCAVGCTLQSLGVRNTSAHSFYEKRLGILETLAHLEDRIFEGLPNADAMTWPIEFTKAIRPGADLSLVWPRFALWLLSKQVLKSFDTDAFPRQRDAIKDVISLYDVWVSTGERPASYAASYAASDAASDAARAASYAARAASYAARAASYAARAASYAAADAVSYAASYAASYKLMAKELLRLLKAAPVKR